MAYEPRGSATWRAYANAVKAEAIDQLIDRTAELSDELMAALADAMASRGDDGDRDYTDAMVAASAVAGNTFASGQANGALAAAKVWAEIAIGDLSTSATAAIAAGDVETITEAKTWADTAVDALRSELLGSIDGSLEIAEHYADAMGDLLGLAIAAERTHSDTADTTQSAELVAAIATARTNAQAFATAADATLQAALQTYAANQASAALSAAVAGLPAVESWSFTASGLLSTFSHAFTTVNPQKATITFVNASSGAVVRPSVQQSGAITVSALLPSGTWHATAVGVRL